MLASTFGRPARRVRRSLSGVRGEGSRRLLIAASGLLIAVSSLPAQPGWRITSSTAADRWFAAMAQLDLPTPGALGYYAKSARRSPAWRANVARSRALDVLHFVPLYFPSGTPAALVAAARAAALGQAPPVPRASFLVGALRRTITTPDDRRALAMIAALADSADGAAVAASRIAALQATWDSAYAPALAPYLAARRLDGGVLFVSPPLGAEGRIFEGRPNDRADNVMAVGTAPESGVAEAPLLAAVRESCSPLVTELSANRRVWRDDPLIASRATVRCGAALMDRALPARSDAYRTLWARLAGARRFADAFPPRPDEDAAIDAALQRAFRTRTDH